GDRVVLDGAALHRLPDRAAAIEPGGRAAPVPALAHVVGIVERRRASRLELGELQLLPQPVDDLVDLQLDHEADLAVLGAARLRGPLAFLADRKSTRLNSSHLGISYAVFC